MTTYGTKWVNLHSKICLYTSVCGSPFEISKKDKYLGTNGVYGNYAMPSSLARHHIRESCNAILFSQSSYMWIVLCHIFSIMYSICQQCLYIHLLFLCISHLSRSWENLEWKQGLLSSQCYLSMQISSWLQIAPQRRIQREMTSRIPPEVHALTWLGYIAHIMHKVSYIAMPSA